MNVLAGITLYNPDLSKLRDNITAVQNQVSFIVCIDNRSRNIEDICKLLGNFPNVFLQKCERNLGVAAALNLMFQYADTHGYDWVLTLDQDTVCPSDLISSYQKATDEINDPKLAVLCPILTDRNFVRPVAYNGSHEQVSGCITSASLNRLDAWKAVGGFYEPLFIDCVDYDFCARLIEHDYRIERVNTVSILHEIGHGENHHFLWKTVTVLNHPPMRKYYMVRNHIFYMKIHKKVVNYGYEKAKLVFLFVKTALYEKDKTAKLKAMFRGKRDSKQLIEEYRKYELQNR